MELIINQLRLSEELKQEFIHAAEGHRQVFAPRGTKKWEAGAAIDPALFEEATIILGNPPVDRLRKNKVLRFLQTGSAGFDQYLQPGVLPEGAIVRSASGGHGIAVAEHLFAMMLSILKHLPNYREQQLHGTWADQGQVRSVTELTVLVVGPGDLGSNFASLCSAVGARTMAVRRHPEVPAAGVQEMYSVNMLDELLPRADVVCLMLPQSDETRGILDLRRMRLMKPDAILLNGGRGSAIPNDDLAAALAEGRFLGVGLDVTENEPLPEGHPIRSCERVILTPHIGGAAHMQLATDRVNRIALKNLKAFLAGEL